MVACPPGQFSGTLLRVKNASEGEAGTRIGGRRHQRLLPQPPGRYEIFPGPGTLRKHGNLSGLSLEIKKITMLVQIGYVLDIRSDRFPETFLT